MQPGSLVLVAAKTIKMQIISSDWTAPHIALAVKATPIGSFVRARTGIGSLVDHWHRQRCPVRGSHDYARPPSVRNLFFCRCGRALCADELAGDRPHRRRGHGAGSWSSAFARMAEMDNDHLRLAAYRSFAQSGRPPPMHDLAERACLPHLLPGEGEVLVATRCPACSRPHAWNVGEQRPPGGGQVAHFLVPASRMCDDVVHTSRLAAVLLRGLRQRLAAVHRIRTRICDGPRDAVDVRRTLV